MPAYLRLVLASLVGRCVGRCVVPLVVSLCSAFLLVSTTFVAPAALAAPVSVAISTRAPVAAAVLPDLAVLTVQQPQTASLSSLPSLPTLTRFGWHRGSYWIVTSGRRWLAYGTAAAWHATRHWHLASTGRVVSEVPSWVPSPPAAAVSAPVAPVAPAAALLANGHAPVSSGHASPVVNAIVRQTTAGQPCSAPVVFPSSIGPWTVPLGCYAGVYVPNPAQYPSRPSYGWCNWWPEVLHPADPGYSALHGPLDGSPHPGDVVHFSGGVQGASSAGHYAQVVAVAPGNYWVLVTEMSFYWRGGGFGKVDYRFIHVGPGVAFSRA